MTGISLPVRSVDAKVQIAPYCDVILLAEDNEDHVMLTRRAFKMAGLINPLFVVQDGEEAIAYLSGEGKFSNRTEYPLPTLLLLDLKMPHKNGFEVLEWLRTQPTLAALRVVVLTTSDRIHDVNRAYQLGANSFLTKPVDFRDFVQLSSAIKGYWLWMSRSPEVERPSGVKKEVSKETPQGGLA
ncbi:MAG TPA: response regulator [Candidatus Binatia bacterium]|nr:response regulator [Candidatus Binatia bacterium]